jgi:hypothetical protein
MKYIVKLSKAMFLPDCIFTFYIYKVTSYKRQWSGIKYGIDIGHAHKYCSESTARKAALAYNGEVVII